MTNEELQKTVHDFHAFALPGQPQRMHMGTSYLVNDLVLEIERLEAAPKIEFVSQGQLESELLNDRTRIMQVTPYHGGLDAPRTWKESEEIQIYAYPEPGPSGPIPFIRVIFHDQVLARVPALMVEIQYRIDPPKSPR